MTWRAFLGRLAADLAQLSWDTDRIADRLRHRLPPRYRRYSDRIAEGLTAASGSAPSPRGLAERLGALDMVRRIYEHCRRAETWPLPVLQSPRMCPQPAFARLDLPDLPTEAALADWLVMPPERLAYFADLRGRAEAHGETAVNHYVYKRRPKRSGGVRLIEAPKPGLKGLQRTILHRLLDRVPAHPAAYGFVRGRSCIEAAARHAGEEMVVGFDLADFFGSVGGHRVYGLFRALGYPHNVAMVLRGLTTTATPPWMLERLPAEMRPHLRMPHLPQGAPTSPALANLTAFRLDRRLSGLARSLGARYTRYADDLTFSGDRRIAGRLLTVVPDIAAQEGFRVNPDKTRRLPNHARQRVTGITVNRGTNLPRPHYDCLKAILHACARPDDERLADPAFRAHLAGRIAWATALNPAKGAKLRARLDSALAARQ